MPEPGLPAHLRYLQTHHPNDAIPTRRESYESYLRSRYGGSPTRCCWLISISLIRCFRPFRLSGPVCPSALCLTACVPAG